MANVILKVLHVGFFDIFAVDNLLLILCFHNFLFGVVCHFAKPAYATWIQLKFTQFIFTQVSNIIQCSSGYNLNLHGFFKYPITIVSCTIDTVSYLKNRVLIPLSRLSIAIHLYTKGFFYKAKFNADHFPERYVSTTDWFLQ